MFVAFYKKKRGHNREQSEAVWFIIRSKRRQRMPTEKLQTGEYNYSTIWGLILDLVEDERNHFTIFIVTLHGTLHCKSPSSACCNRINFNG